MAWHGHNAQKCILLSTTVKPVVSGHSKDQKLFFKTNSRLMQVKSIAECSKGEHSAILSTVIKLPFVIKIFFCQFLSDRLRRVYCTGQYPDILKHLVQKLLVYCCSFFF